MKYFLSVVIPAFNERASIRSGNLEEVYGYLKDMDFDWEVLIVDDGSTDSTASLVQKFAEGHKGFRLLMQPHGGKGRTVISGMLEAKGDIVLFTDMDQATPISELKKFLPKFSQGYDIVIGSRTGRKGANWIRKLMAYGFIFLRTIILRLPFRDTQCGFKAFSRRVIAPIVGKMKIFGKDQSVAGAAVTAGFDLELLYIARKLGYRIAEVPVEWTEKGTRGDFGVNPIKDSWEGFRDLMKVRINAIKGEYR